MLRDVEGLLSNYLAIKPRPPVNVAVLGRLRGCKIEPCSLPTHVSGLLVPTSRGSVIKVNVQGPNLHATRQRFTIAHEIAHTFFYRKTPDGRYEKVSGTLSHYEEEELCNFAAGYMLLPSRLIRESLPELGEPDVNLVLSAARMFQVSTEVAARRLKQDCKIFSNVGLCEWLNETTYLRTRQVKFSKDPRYGSLVLTWMVPPELGSTFPVPRRTRLLAKSPIWELCSGQRQSVRGSEVRLGSQLIARLGAAVVYKNSEKPFRVLATILDLRRASKSVREPHQQLC